MSVVVIGGGWAGLAAALELVRHRVPVTVLEASRQLGGRARRVPFQDHHVDNGQHLLLGAYSTVLSLLELLGIPEKKVLRRTPLRLTLYDRDDGELSLQVPALLPAPLNSAYAIAAARGMSIGDKRAVVRFMRMLARPDFELAGDSSVEEFLHCHGQSAHLQRRLWQPLCLASLNTPIANASAQVFIKVLRAAFMDARRASHLLLPVTDLGLCFPEPARDYIERYGGSVRLGVRAQALEIRQTRVHAVHLEQSSLLAEHVIVAGAPRACVDLLRPHIALATLAATIENLRHNPIATIYLQYPRHIRLQHEFIGLVGTHAQWLFDRGQLTGEHGLFAAVISGPGPHTRWDNARLIEQVTQEIAMFFPDWPPPLHAKVIRERQATFAAEVGCEELRPHYATPVRGLWLAGDYTATGFPATLEGAVRSGVECARQILEHERTHAKRPSTARSS